MTCEDGEDDGDGGDDKGCEDGEDGDGDNGDDDGVMVVTAMGMTAMAGVSVMGQGGVQGIVVRNWFC